MITAPNDRPALIVAELDICTNARGLAVMRRSGCGDAALLVVLGYGPDIEERAAAMGALVGFRKPLSVGWFMSKVSKTLDGLSLT